MRKESHFTLEREASTLDFGETYHSLSLVIQADHKE